MGDLTCRGTRSLNSLLVFMKINSFFEKTCLLPLYDRNIVCHCLEVESIEMSKVTEAHLSSSGKATGSKLELVLNWHHPGTNTGTTLVEKR